MKASSRELRIPMDDAQSESISLTIDGMTCGSCVRNVEKALNGVTGVRSVSVDLANKSAVVNVRPSATPQLLMKAVEALGFNAAWDQNVIPQPNEVGPQSDSCCCGPE